MLDTFELGPIRPTSEAASLLIRVTRGCAWNRCRFCNNYRTETFALRPVSVLKEEIDLIARYRDMILEYETPEGFDMVKINAYYRSLPADARQCYATVFNWLSCGEYSVFLQDADAMILKCDDLAEVLRYIRLRLPETTRITSYGRPDTLARKTAEEYAVLKGAGLGRIHAGFESGCEEVLKRIEKGVTTQQEIIGGRNVMSSGIELSVFLMAGVGGRALSEKNAIQTAQVINAVDPSFVRLRTCVVIKGTPLWEDLQSGRFDECTDMEQLMEMRTFLDHIEGCTGRVYSDHMINLMQELEGPLSDSKALVAQMDAYLNLPRAEQRRYQLAKRMGFNGTWQDMPLLSPSDAKKIDDICARVPDGEEWETILKNLLRRYI